MHGVCHITHWEFCNVFVCTMQDAHRRWRGRTGWHAMVSLASISPCKVVRSKSSWDTGYTQHLWALMGNPYAAWQTMSASTSGLWCCQNAAPATYTSSADLLSAADPVPASASNGTAVATSCGMFCHWCLCVVAEAFVAYPTIAVRFPFVCAVSDVVYFELMSLLWKAPVRAKIIPHIRTKVCHPRSRLLLILTSNVDSISRVHARSDTSQIRSTSSKLHFKYEIMGFTQQSRQDLRHVVQL